MSQSAIPAHVPPALVFDFDYISATNNVSDPYAALVDLDQRGAPEFFYSPRHGGHWVARRYETVREIFRDNDHFGTYPIVIPPMKDQPAPMIPIQTDPPLHQKYRILMGPLFTPAAVKRMESILVKTAVELIEPIAVRGKCDFVREYSHKFPPLVFMRIMGMSEARLEEFVEWAKLALVGTPSEQASSAAKIIAFVNEFVDQKPAALADDWASVLISAKDESGAPALSREELVNMIWFLFLAGLDTVSNSLAHSWRFFAEHPEEQQRLRDQPDQIPAAFEEMLRLNVITNNSRRVREDMDFNGLKLKAGEPILLLVATANRDAARFKDPLTPNLSREDNVHMTFGAGIHRCIGSNIARAELKISLLEWQKRIPTYQIEPGFDVRSVGGVTMGLQSLPLIWNAGI